MDRSKVDNAKKRINGSRKHDNRFNERTWDVRTKNNIKFDGFQDPVGLNQTSNIQCSNRINFHEFRNVSYQKEDHKYGRNSTDVRLHSRNSTYGFQNFRNHQNDSYAHVWTSDLRFNNRNNSYGFRNFSARNEGCYTHGRNDAQLNNQSNSYGFRNVSARNEGGYSHGRNDAQLNNQSHTYGFRNSRDPEDIRRPNVESVEFSPPKLVGHFETDRYGSNLVLDGNGGVRVYNLQVQRKQIVTQSKDSNIGEAVDWAQLIENESKAGVPSQTVTIPNCYDLNFDLLNGYVPMKDGGNMVSLCGVPCDRTAGIRWMVENHEKLKCGDGSRLFDIDFYAGNGAMQYIMACQFDTKYEKDADIAVILFKGTYFLFVIDLCNESTKEVYNKFSFGGIRFEDYVTRGMNGEESGPSNGLHNNYVDFKKYSNVVRFNFHNFKMLVSGNVDCAIPGSSAAIGQKPNADDFIELKTSTAIEDKDDPSRMSETFSAIKSWSWFAQSVLMGVKTVVVGIRDDGCKKLTVKRTRVFTLEELQESGNGFWSKDKCFDALKKFLCVVKDKVTVDDPDIINVFELKKGWIRGPEKRTYADNPVRYPDISKVVEMMNKL